MSTEIESQYTKPCLFEVAPATRYLDSGEPGDPAEYCSNDAEPGEDYCDEHLRYVAALADEGDRMYEEARDARWEREDEEAGHAR